MSQKHKALLKQLELKFLMIAQESHFMGGDMTTTRLWEAYIKAHNEKDLKTIQKY